ncbi:hypothetical protein CMV_001974 [Castanea mollissima]|uniref:Uncharacterized protein n=1 Tax=Castanea mollissima TaxID=60419 RepID=A0A8J4RQS2_9ROSI|nr:hypothetical protein CMV_001974 [Castanea mollissima]
MEKFSFQSKPKTSPKPTKPSEIFNDSDAKSPQNHRDSKPLEYITKFDPSNEPTKSKFKHDGCDNYDDDLLVKMLMKKLKEDEEVHDNTPPSVFDLLNDYIFPSRGRDNTLPRLSRQ